jgi:hypothetical protein
MNKISISARIALLSASLLAPTAAVARTVTIPFSASNFSDPLDIDNPYFPLVPGTVFTYRAATPDGCEVDVMTVTNNTRAIAGITARVVHDVVSEGETCGKAEPVEDTLDFYAQDNSGNVWYMGEHSEDCEDGTCTLNEGSWEAGKDIFNIGQNAKAGIIMLAHPRSGDSYRQEFYPGHAEDEATITAVGITGRLKRPDAYRRTIDNCIVTKEFTDLEKGSIGFKTYCPGIGIILDVDHHGKVQRSELVSITSTAGALKFRTVPKH